MRNETDRDTIEQATVLYLTEKTAATIYGSWRDINRVSDAAYKVADACERAYQDSGAYEDKKQSLRWCVTAEQWHYKNNIDYSHRSAYRARESIQSLRAQERRTRHHHRRTNQPHSVRAHRNRSHSDHHRQHHFRPHDTLTLSPPRQTRKHVIG